MKGRWILLLAGAGAAAVVAGVAVGRGINAAVDTIQSQLPPLAMDFPDGLHRAVMNQLNTTYPGATISTFDPARGYRMYTFKTLQGIQHQIIYRADGTVYSQS